MSTIARQTPYTPPLLPLNMAPCARPERRNDYAVVDSEIQPKETGQVVVKDNHFEMLGNVASHRLLHESFVSSSKRVVSSREFHASFSNPNRIRTEVIKALSSSSGDKRPGNLGSIDKVATFVSNGVREDELFLSALQDNDDNTTFLESIQNWHAPGCSFCGNILGKSSRRPRNAQQILESFISWGREGVHVNRSSDPGSSGYDFTLTPDDPTLDGAMHEDVSIRTWIDKKIIRPGTAVADQQLTESQKTCFINAVKTDLVPKELHHVFGVALKGLKSTRDSVHDYSTQLIGILHKIFPHQDVAFTELLSRGITTILINKVLSIPVKNALSNATVRIAIAKPVGQDLKPVCLACYYDPVAKAVALCVVDEKDNLVPQEQRLFIDTLPWEHCGVSLILAPLSSRRVSVRVRC